MRALSFLFLSAALVMGTGCGDDGGGGDTSTGDTGTADTGGGGDTGTGDTGTMDTGTGGDTGTMGDGGGDGGGGDGGGGDGGGGDGGGGDGGGGDGGSASAAAMAFCTGYEAACGYAMMPTRFNDEAACLSFYDMGSMDCTTCLSTHLTAAATDAAAECPNATGRGDCETACTP